MSGGADSGGRRGPVLRPPVLQQASRENLRSFDSTELFGGETEIRIVHQNAVYHLKITRQGKLILNK
jgi:hemin uptake protein HemP